MCNNASDRQDSLTFPRIDGAILVKSYSQYEEYMFRIFKKGEYRVSLFYLVYIFEWKES